MSTVNAKLRYLFTAEYDDGTKYVQPEDDVSRLHPGSEDFTPSAFRDVDHDKLVRFSLSNTKGKEIVAVDLRTGLFTINGQEFSTADQNFFPKTKPKLIYFREVRQEFIVGADGEMVPTDRHYINRYFIGWEAKDQQGVNHTQTLGVA